MTIWFQPFDLAQLNLHSKGTLVELLGIRLTDFGDDFLVASMEVTSALHQPMHIMHGGASCVLAETVGSIAANLCVDVEKKYAVGLDINVNHIRQVKSGIVHGIAKPFQLGKSIQVWGIEILNAEKKLISISRLTVAVLEKKQNS